MSRIIPPLTPRSRMIQMARCLMQEGRPCSFVASGSSMSPLIQDGDSLTMIPPATRLRVGQIVAVACGEEQLLVHRIVRITPTGLITRGDNCGSLDPPVPRNCILGCITVATRNGRARRLGISTGTSLLGRLARYRPLSRWLRPITPPLH